MRETNNSCQGQYFVNLGMFCLRVSIFRRLNALVVKSYLPTAHTLHASRHRIPTSNTAATNLKLIKIKVFNIGKAIDNLFDLG